MAADGVIYLPCSMKIGSGIQVILTFYLDNLRGYGVPDTNEKDL
jgi:hypothetical protein